MSTFDPSRPPPVTGSYEDARRLAEWDFLRKSPEQRLRWLIDMLQLSPSARATDTATPPSGTTGQIP